MKNFKLVVLLIFLASILVSCAPKNEEPLEVVKVTRGDISASIPSTGTVMPRNRVEIKPPVAGRVEDVLVQEGNKVKKSQVIAWISSNERAALLDAARAKGPEEVKYWEQVYKPAPIVAPLNGFIILRAVEPGQSVATSDPVLVMADKLIIKAQVDETDLSHIKLNQKVVIQLDAYPENKIPGYVEHIEYESQVINNVTIYQVYVFPNSVPAFFRSGMSATLDFMQESKKDVLMVLSKAVKKNVKRSYVFVKEEGQKEPTPIQVQTGLETSDKIEIVSGVKLGDEVVIPTAKMVQTAFEKIRGGPRPFNPFGGGGRR